MFFYNQYFYLFTLAMQAICIIHCIRRQNYSWIWLIVFLPVIGCIIYFFKEMVNGNQVAGLQSGVASVIRPKASIRKLEEQLKFTDTFNNRVMLADAYFSAGELAKAISMYESSLTGAFDENEYVMMQLVLAYYETGRYQDLVTIAKRLYKRPQFARSRAHMFYALALEKTGNIPQADIEFASIRGRFSYYESRYEYALFLARNARMQDARTMLDAILEEATQLSGREKRENQQWFSKSREALQKMQQSA